MSPSREVCRYGYLIDETLTFETQATERSEAFTTWTA